MPWQVVRRQNRWCVYKLDADGNPTGAALKCHPTERAAQAHVRALYANEEEMADTATHNEQRQMLVDLFAFNADSPEGPYLVMPLGEFTRNGRPFQVTEEMLDEFIANYENGVPNRPAPTNIEHREELGRVGEVTKLFKRAGEGLYALINWTERGLQLLREESFRFLSPEVYWTGYEATDGTLHNNVFCGLAITNYPWFGRELALFTERAREEANVRQPESFMYDMVDGSGDTLYMLRMLSHRVKMAEEDANTDPALLERMRAARDEVKALAAFEVDQYADAPDASEPETESDTFATKREQGYDWPSSAFLVVPDAEKPSDWKLRFKEIVDGKPTVTKAQLGRAAAALGKGFRGNRVQLTQAQRASALRKLRGLYRQIGVAEDEMPDVVKMSEMPAAEQRNLLERFFAWLASDEMETSAVEGDNDMADEETVVAQANEPDGQTVTEETPPETEPVLASDTPPATATDKSEAQFAAIMERLSALEKRNNDLQTALDAEKAKAARFSEQFEAEAHNRKMERFSQTAAEKYGAVPGKPDEIGATLLWAFDSDTTEKKEHYHRFTGYLDALNAANMEKFREQGYTNNVPQNDEFQALLDARIAEKQQAGSRYAEAYRDALAELRETKPELARKWAEKQRPRAQ